MLKTSEAYRRAITGSPRQMEVLAVVDITDPDAVFAPVTCSAQAAWSEPEQIGDHIFDISPRHITCEDNLWLFDGKSVPLPTDESERGSVGGVSAELSGEDGSFASPVWFQRNFTGMTILQACAVYFPTDVMMGVGADFTVEVYEGETVRHSQTFTGNTSPVAKLTGFTVSNPTALRVTITRWSLPYRRARVAELLPGIYERWDGDVLSKFSAVQQADVSCLTLPYGSVTLTMDNSSRRFEPRSKDGLFQSLTERQGVEVSLGVHTADGEVEYCRLGTYYQFGDGWRTGDNELTMQWYLVDIIGLLAKRDFIAPSPLPTTLSGWIAALCAQLGKNFAGRWHVDSNYADAPMELHFEEKLESASCGDVLRWVCQASGTWPRADAETGYLTVEPLWSEGNKVTLDDLPAYPTVKANDDVAALIFSLGAGSEQVVVSGTAAGGRTVPVANPFLTTPDEARTAARLILSSYGGNKYELIGRGDPASEIGDVDTVWLDESQATTARRIRQTLTFERGVLQRCRSTLIQADGSFLFQHRAVLTADGTFTAPAGVTQLRLILVGRGSRGGDGDNGSYDRAGADGTAGAGGQVWSGLITVNPGQSFAVTIGSATTFGSYSSAQGARYAYGYTDVQSGDSFARSGVSAPVPGTGDGGVGGAGGSRGVKRTRTIHGTDMSTGQDFWIDVEEILTPPGYGSAGVDGVSGCAVVYWDDPE